MRHGQLILDGVGKVSGIMEPMDAQASTAPAVLGVVFDGDDTLWSTERLYDDARSDARRIVERSGLDGATWEAIERQIDVENVAIFGFGTARFPTSCVQAYEQLCRAGGTEPDAAVAAGVRDAALAAFERDPELMPGARETLAALRARGMRLALLTKGEPELQARRINRSGLRGFFDAVHIVGDKSPGTLRSVVGSLGVDVSSAWMVGNSVRSDVLPALDAGLRAIWVNSHVWEYERTHDHLIDHRVVTASELAAVLEIIAR